MNDQEKLDQALIKMWLAKSKSNRTREEYGRDAARFMKFVNKPLCNVTLDDLQKYADNLDKLAFSTSSQARMLTSIKSLFSFGNKSGVLSSNPAIMLTMPIARCRTAEKIMSESDVKRMVEATNSFRDRLLIRFLYISGGRITETLQIRFEDLKAREDGGGQVTFYGKGMKTRAVRIPPALWQDLMMHPHNPKDRVFPMNRQNAHYIIKKVAERAGLGRLVSAHWFRHANATHALKNGASLILVQKSLGHSSITTTSNYLHIMPSESASQFLIEV